jgi:hypothetical protein
VERISYAYAARRLCQALDHVPRLKLRVNPDHSEPRVTTRRPKPHDLPNIHHKKMREHKEYKAKPT